MKYFGLLMMVAGVAVGLWCGVWWAFIGGIAGIVGEVRAEAIDGVRLALLILRVMFAGFITYTVSTILVLPGFLFWSKD